MSSAISFPITSQKEFEKALNIAFSHIGSDIFSQYGGGSNGKEIFEISAEYSAIPNDPTKFFITTS